VRVADGVRVTDPDGLATECPKEWKGEDGTIVVPSSESGFMKDPSRRGRGGVPEERPSA
jgi:hypothetical protein